MGWKEQIREWRSDAARKTESSLYDTCLVLHRDEAKHRWCVLERAFDPGGAIRKWHAVAYQKETAFAVAGAVAEVLGLRAQDEIGDWGRDDKTIKGVWMP